MSAKRIPSDIEVHELGGRRLYVKASVAFVLGHDDLTPEDLRAIATDIAARDEDAPSATNGTQALAPE